jgi:lysophospholipase L1-like esterase
MTDTSTTEHPPLEDVRRHAAPEPRFSLPWKVVAVTVAVLVAAGAVLLAVRQDTSPRATAAAISAPGAGDTVPQLSVPGITRLLVYGHSMPLGGGATDPSLAYPVLAAEQLGLRLVNRAVGASGAANATKTMEAARPARSRDAVVLHTGMNDVFRRGDAAVGRGRQAVRSFLAGTEGAGLRVIVTECQPGAWEYTPKGLNLQPAYEAWNAMLREEAAASGNVGVLDTCETWNTGRFTEVERFHPNDVGHARMAAELAALLADS